MGLEHRPTFVSAALMLGTPTPRQASWRQSRGAIFSHGGSTGSRIRAWKVWWGVPLLPPAYLGDCTGGVRQAWSLLGGRGVCGPD